MFNIKVLNDESVLCNTLPVVVVFTIKKMRDTPYQKISTYFLINSIDMA